MLEATVGLKCFLYCNQEDKSPFYIRHIPFTPVPRTSDLCVVPVSVWVLSRDSGFLLQSTDTQGFFYLAILWKVDELVVTGKLFFFF